MVLSFNMIVLISTQYMKKLPNIIFLFGFFLSTLGAISCGQGDDNPCNGEDDVYYAKANKLIEALNTDSNQYFLYTNLKDSLLESDSIKLVVTVDTPFIYKDYSGWNWNYCYDCGAEVETFVATISNIPNQDEIVLEYDDCLEYRMIIDRTTYEFEYYLRYNHNRIDIQLNDTFGINYIIEKKNFKIERLR